MMEIKKEEYEVKENESKVIISESEIKEAKNKPNKMMESLENSEQPDEMMETPVRKPVIAETEDFILSFVCLVLGYFFIRNTLFSTHLDTLHYSDGFNSSLRFTTGLGMFVFTLVFVLAISLFAKKKKIKASRESIVWMCFLLLQGLAFFLFTRPSLDEVPLLGLFVTAIYWVLCRMNYLKAGKTSDYLVKDIASGVFLYPFRYFGNLGRVLGASVKKKKVGKETMHVIAGIIVGIPILAILYLLLCEVDEGFATMFSIQSWIDGIFERQMIHVVIMVFGIPTGCYMFGLIHGLATNTNEDTSNELVVPLTGKCGFVSMTTITTILTMVTILYVAFFAVQTGYLFSAFSNRLPEQYTYAEYARKGFFELCVLCVLNLILLFFAHLVCKGANAKVLKVFSLSIYGFNLLFCIIAFRKMLLYITTYGLTSKRMLTCWFMAFIAVVIVIGILREFLKFSLLRYVSFAMVILFTTCCFSNMDGMIAKNNGWLYESGKVETLDYETLAACGPAALPTINKLLDSNPDHEVKIQLENVKFTIEDNYYDVNDVYEIVVQKMLVK